MKYFKDVYNHCFYKISNISKLFALSFSNKKPLGKSVALLNGMSCLCEAQDINECGGGWDAHSKAAGSLHLL